MASAKTVLLSAMALGAAMALPSLAYGAQSTRVDPSTPACDGTKKPPFAEPQCDGTKKPPFAEPPQCDGEKKPDTKPKS